MSKYLVDSTDMTAIANAIRGKTGSSSSMTVADMPTEIASITTGDTDYLAQRVQGTLTSYTIPNTCTQVSDGALAGATSLQSVTFPSTVTSIGQQAFYYCTSLSTVNLSQGLTSIGVDSFRYCASLQSIVIPSTVTRIYSSAFVDSGLTSITITNPLRIDSWAFQNTNLQSVYLPAGSRLSYGLFDECHSLTTVSFPSDLTVIPEHICRECTNLTSVTLGSNITAVSSEAFKNTKLSGDITVSNTCRFDSECFRYLNGSGTLYIHLPATTNISSAYTMSNTAFDQQKCKLVVPRGTLSTYQTYYNYYYYLFVEEGSY